MSALNYPLPVDPVVETEMGLESDSVVLARQHAECVSLLAAENITDDINQGWGHVRRLKHGFANWTVQRRRFSTGRLARLFMTLRIRDHG